MELKFYRCEKCGKVLIVNHELNLEQFKEIKPFDTEGAAEKHIPVVKKACRELIVTVGEVLHPMTAEHSIEWVLVEKENGYEIKYLEAGATPEVRFPVKSGEVKAVYAYCNLHGLWKA
ncbi:MAG: desulfoferrodoxin [Clostridia bacterium]|nr:desulfoferrodoxin [Clostridia bacterium]